MKRRVYRFRALSLLQVKRLRSKDSYEGRFRQPWSALENPAEARGRNVYLEYSGQEGCHPAHVTMSGGLVSEDWAPYRKVS